MAPQNRWFSASPNSDYFYKALTDGTVTKMTSGRIPTMNAQQAAGLIGSWLIETGRKDLGNLDVVEAGSGRGRGLSQYTGVRRGPYDAAVAKAKAAGVDTNSAQWQLQYFAQEYMNRDLIGWTQVFEKMPKNLKSAGDYAKYFTGSAAEGKGYFRPGTPHTDRRMQAAQEVLQHYLKPPAQAPSTPAAPASNKPVVNPGFVNKLMQQLGIGKQSFNMDKLQNNLGNIASAGNVQDAGFAIFSSTKYGKGNAQKAWNKLPTSSKQAWSSVGGHLGIGKVTQDLFQNKAPVTGPKMPTSTGVGASQYNPASKVDLSIRGVQPGDLGYGGNPSHAVGGLPGLHEIAQAGVGNYGTFKEMSNKAAQRTFSMSSRQVSKINARAYGGDMDLGKTLGINTKATSKAGDKYGAKANKMDTKAINKAAWGT